VERFKTVRDAKEYLVSRIVAEADREGVALSDIERKMLYFSETGWTLPDMQEVSEDFDRDSDQEDYEAKIAGIIRNAQPTDGIDLEMWDEAVYALAREDHYLSVLIGEGNNSVRPAAVSPFVDRLKLVAAAAAIIVVMMAWSYFFGK
jgi:hypothetical protein